MFNPKNKGIGIIILAAGSSSRLGQSKQLVEFEGETLLRRITKTALQSKADSVLVVLGSEHEKHYENIKDLPILLVYNPNWQKGMGSSLKAALDQLFSIPFHEWEAVLVLVCDQVFLTVAHIDLLISAFLENKSVIIASHYEGIIGVPAIFGRDYFSELQSINDQDGAKKVIMQNQSNVISIDFYDGKFDLDTKQDLERLIKDQSLHLN